MRKGSDKYVLRAVSALATLRIALSLIGCGDDAHDDAPQTTTSDGDGGTAAPVIDAGTDGGDSPKGGVCNDRGFCWENPLPHGVGVNDLSATAPNDVWVAGYPGTLLHYDGASWSVAELPTYANLSAVWGSAPTDVWVAGYEYVGAHRTLLFHYDGKAWTQSFASSPSPDAGAAELQHVNDLWGASAHDVWAVGDTGTVLHWDGAKWSAQASGTTARISRVVGTSATDVWALPQSFASAESVKVLHFDGVSWSTVDTGQIGSAWTLWATGKDVWLPSERLVGADDAGSGGTVAFSMIHRDGATWGTTPSAAKTSIFSMWGSGPNDVWGAGSGYDPDAGSFGSLVRFDGTSWREAPLSPVPPLRAIAGTAPNDVWTYDDTGRLLLHFDGNTVTRSAQKTASGADLRDVWGAQPDDVWAVGAVRAKGELLRRSGGAWARVDIGATTPLVAVSGSATDHVWAVGANGTALRFDGKTWSPVATGETGSLAGVWTSGPDDVWAVGTDESDGGYRPIALHYDGHGWTSKVPPDAMILRAVAGSGPKDVWATGFATGTAAALYHFDGATWSRMTDLPKDGYASDALGIAGPGKVWLGGAYFDGATWTVPPQDSHVAIVGTFVRSPTDVWMMSAMGEVLHYDGTRLGLYSVTGPAASSMGGVGSDLYVVGSSGQIMRKAL